MMKTLLMLTAVAFSVSSAALEPGDAHYLEAPNRPAPFDMPEVPIPTFPDRDFNILDYGAVADGSTLNTEAIAAAIAACNAAGGGRVVIPPGVWKTGPIHLKSHVNLHVSEGAVVRFSDNPEHYLPVVFTRWAGFELYNYSPLIYARDCENIGITGRGILDGNGRNWWHWSLRDVTETAPRIAQQVLDGVPPEERIYGTPEWPLRPQFINPVNCRGILLEDFTLLSGPFWTIQLTYAENVRVRRLTVRTSGPNSDGINLDSARNVIIEDCRVSTYDDSVAIKSGINEDGRRVGRPTENVIVRRCLFEKGQGGVSIGSEMSGDVRNIYVHDTIFRGLWMALWIKSTRGRGGVVENVWYENLLINRISNFAIGITTAYSAFMGTTEGAPPTIRNINYRNITVPYALRSIDFAGLPEVPLQNISFTNTDITGYAGVRIADVDGLVFDNAIIHALNAETLLGLTNTANVTVKNTAIPVGPDVLVQLEGERTRAVSFDNLHLPEGMELYRKGGSVPADAVTGAPAKEE